VCGRERRFVQSVDGETRIDHLEDLGVDVSTLVRWVVQK
jgi:hypothetical protein